MSDFLLELLCEEIPARMQAKASTDLARLFTEELAKVGLKATRLTSYVTPRRLALIAHDLPVQTQAGSEEFKGPRTSAPAQALEGFLRKTGLTQDQLEDRDGVWFAVVEKAGQASADVLAQAIPAIIRAFPWPKSMRWGAASASTTSLRWVRPLQGIIALLGNELVPMEVDGIVSGYATVGHRFHHAGASPAKVGTGFAPGDATTERATITIGSASDYAEKLRACHVIVDAREREAMIAARAAAAAQAAGLELVEDKGLVAENAGLTEWPVPLLGHFDPAFLDVPPEVIQLTMRTNQKYFAVRDAEGKLAPAFICTANIDAHDGGAAIIAGNQKVLAARLSDARFFWEQDKKTRLAVHAEKLSRITFHEKLGTVADKVDRVAKLARWLVEEGIVNPPQDGEVAARSADGGGMPQRGAVSGNGPLHHPAAGPPPRAGEDLADLAEQAARLCKADLVTEMVGEFPELQGLMGGYYARAEGLDPQIADAIRDHYKPVGQGDDVPTAPVTVAVSLADKLDTLAGFFAANLRPTGSRDPFALRRAALAIISIAQDNRLRLSMSKPLAAALAYLIGKQSAQADHLAYEIGVDQLEDAGVNFSAEAKQALRDIALKSSVGRASALYDQVIEPTISSVVRFMAERLKVQQREAGIRHDLIDAVFALPDEDDLVRLLARVHALQAFVTTEDGANLLAGYKRAANILKKEQPAPMAGPQDQGIPQTGEEDPFVMVDDPLLADAVAEFGHVGFNGYTPEPAEAALAAALDTAEPRADDAIATEDFAGAMAALASLRAPIDAFFEHVTVNDANPAKRTARLALLQRVRAAVHKVADFSKIEG
ncbi:MAG: glycine--tRNA ligase subunit beta [Sphingobium sp.]